MPAPRGADASSQVKHVKHPEPPAVNCPKCRRLLPPDGEVAVGTMMVPSYTCPECVTRTAFMGETWEMPLTFIVGRDGRPIDPADPEGEIDLTPYD